MTEDKNKEKLNLGVVAAVVIVFLIIAYFSVRDTTQKDNPEVLPIDNPAEIENDYVAEGEDPDMLPVDNNFTEIYDEPAKDLKNMKKSNLLRYEDIELSKLSGKVVLDFSATWCPSCQTLKKDMESKKESIPDDVNIVIVDYDSNIELRKKYGVTGQHTFVQLDDNQNKKKLWRGGTTLEEVLKNIE